MNNLETAQVTGKSNSTLTALSLWKKLTILQSCLIIVIIATGCASTEVVKHNRIVHEKLPRPSRILIYNFIANPADVPKHSSVAISEAVKTSPTMTKENIKLGRTLGASITRQLIQQVKEMGLPAEIGTTSSKPRLNDIVLRGYIVSLAEGDSIKRVVIGFGYGASELDTVVEGYQMTTQGLRKLGAINLKSVGSKSPGGGVGALSMIANANPAGLIVGGVVKCYGELSGSSKVEGLAKMVVDVLAGKLLTQLT